jgi:hypothetical protein
LSLLPKLVGWLGWDKMRVDGAVSCRQKEKSRGGMGAEVGWGRRWETRNRGSPKNADQADRPRPSPVVVQVVNVRHVDGCVCVVDSGGW